MKSKSNKRHVYCANCEDHVHGQLISGDIAYPNNERLRYLILCQCPDCLQFVATHRKTKDPVGCIPTPKMKLMRAQAHSLIDPIWKTERMSRTSVYRHLTDRLGDAGHAGKTKSEDDCHRLIAEIRQLRLSFNLQG